MKKLITILLCAVSSLSLAQDTYTTARRTVKYRNIGKDSINLSLSHDYELIEDSCAEMIRYGHANLRDRKFKGFFKDVSSKNKTLVLSEGTYSEDGLKEGPFICRYANGNLQSKGTFKDDKPDGHWDIFYENSKPQLDFDVAGGIIKINNAWNSAEKKTIDNGKGNYLSEIDMITWKGKINNGKPEGTWRAYRSTDATETTMVTENFKNGVFQKGESPMGEYTDASRVSLISESLFPYLKAERFQISAISCNGAGFRRIVNAQYRNGLDDFSEAIKEAIAPFLRTVDIKSYDNRFIITGQISPTGQLIKLAANNAFNQNIAYGIIRQLYQLPLLVPASIDGKPVIQNFEITFTFNSGFYSFNYRFLPIKQPNMP